MKHGKADIRFDDDARFIFCKGERFFDIVGIFYDAFDFIAIRVCQFSVRIAVVFWRIFVYRVRKRDLVVFEALCNGFRFRFFAARDDRHIVFDKFLRICTAVRFLFAVRIIVGAERRHIESPFFGTEIFKKSDFVFGRFQSVERVSRKLFGRTEHIAGIAAHRKFFADFLLPLFDFRCGGFSVFALRVFAVFEKVRKHFAVYGALRYGITAFGHRLHICHFLHDGIEGIIENIIIGLRVELSALILEKLRISWNVLSEIGTFFEFYFFAVIWAERRKRVPIAPSDQGGSEDESKSRYRQNDDKTGGVKSLFHDKILILIRVK